MVKGRLLSLCGHDKVFFTKKQELLSRRYIVKVVFREASTSDLTNLSRRAHQ
jgi:hypothetical protein